MSAVQWEEPPPIKQHGRGRPTVWAARLAPLMERPGAWAKVDYEAKAITSRSCFTTGSARLPEGTTIVDWEFTFRKIDGLYHMWARFIGEVQA